MYCIIPHYKKELLKFKKSGTDVLIRKYFKKISFYYNVLLNGKSLLPHLFWEKFAYLMMKNGPVYHNNRPIIPTFNFSNPGWLIRFAPIFLEMLLFKHIFPLCMKTTDQVITGIRMEYLLTKKKIGFFPELVWLKANELS